MRKSLLFIILTAVLLAAWISSGIYIHTRPVSWDAAACSGGYFPYIFDKYNGELIPKYADALEDMVSLSASRDSVTGEMNGREIILEFDVEYKTSSGETVKERVSCRGKRYWIEKFSWSEPVKVSETSN